MPFDFRLEQAVGQKVALLLFWNMKKETGKNKVAAITAVAIIPLNKAFQMSLSLPNLTKKVPITDATIPAAPIVRGNKTAFGPINEPKSIAAINVTA